jgi:TRAP transporter 4TM/12TM fusion protein
MSDVAGGKRVEIDADELVAETDTGARNPMGLPGKLVLALAISWSLFQLYYASFVPFWLHDWVGIPLRDTIGVRINFVLNSGQARVIHLAFAFCLVAFAFPLTRWCPRDRIPVYDWALAALGVGAALYLLVFKDDIAVRAGLPTRGDLIASTIGLVVLGTAVYRSLGLPLLIVAVVFMFYVFFGHHEFVPDAIRWKGASFGKALWHYWMQTEGVFGKPLEVSTTMIFLFVLFGALLEKAGAGGYFIKISFALLGHLRGGPAKAAVVSSGMSGLYSGSSIANVVTTGTFTIPLMKRTGFPAEKAGAVEVASSTNGQLTPPVMGAAAFLMAEYANIPYLDVVKHAFLPAIISYIALFYIVHIEALKLNLRGLPKAPSTRTISQKLLGVVGGFVFMCAIALAVYYGMGWIKVVLPNQATYVVIALLIGAFLLLAWFASQRPDLEIDDPNAPITVLPPAGATAITGLYFVLPIVMLIWLIMIERRSPGLSAFYATVLMAVVMLAQHPVKAFMRGQGDYIWPGLRRGFNEFVDGLISGSRNMTSIAIATAAAGIVVGSVSLTGMHQWIGAFVEWLAAGNLMLMLILVAIMSLILGLGLPTTANYIVVSSLMAPVIVALGADTGLIVPLIAAHMFVFYFGILADDTPPVGLAAFAAAAISGGDPIKTGFQGFAYDIRTAVLPFLFIFNTELLLMDVTPAKAVFVFAIATLAMLIFASATQSYGLVRNRAWETIAFLLIAFTLFRPGFWLDRVQPPYIQEDPVSIMEVAAVQDADGEIRLQLSGPDARTHGAIKVTTILVPLGPEGEGAERLDQAGLTVFVDGDALLVDEPFPQTPFDRLANDFDFYGDVPVTVTTVSVPVQGRMWKEVFYIPALALFAIIVLLQLRRRRVQAGDEAPAPAAA